MRKHKVICVLLLNLLAILWVPGIALSAFDTPESLPVNFALANLTCFPDFLIEEDGRPVWFVETGGARLFEMPEIQPFCIRLGGPAFGGVWRLIGSGLQSGTYGEYSAGVSYGHRLSKGLSAQLETHLLQVSIDNYGRTFSYQINARFDWRVQSGVRLAMVGYNLTNATFGGGGFVLPSRFAAGGRLGPIENVHLFLELEKDSRYVLASRLGIGYQVLEPAMLLFGFQSNPEILSAGISFRIKSYHATAAYQYHPDLGFSQCYGIVITF